MHAAFAISMLAVAMSLGVVFFAVRSGKSRAVKKGRNSDSSSATSSTTGSTDCSPGDNTGCDGGGGSD